MTNFVVNVVPADGRAQPGADCQNVDMYYWRGFNQSYPYASGFLH